MKWGGVDGDSSVVVGNQLREMCCVGQPGVALNALSRADLYRALHVPNRTGWQSRKSKWKESKRKSVQDRVVHAAKSSGLSLAWQWSTDSRSPVLPRPTGGCAGLTVRLVEKGKPCRVQRVRYTRKMIASAMSRSNSAMSRSAMSGSPAWPVVVLMQPVATALMA